MTVQGSYQAANMAKDAPKNVDWVKLPPLAGSAGWPGRRTRRTIIVNADWRHHEPGRCLRRVLRRC